MKRIKETVAKNNSLGNYVLDDHYRWEENVIKVGVIVIILLFFKS